MKGGQKVILCVDDDIDVLAYLRLTLESAGYKVIEAVTAQEALQKLDSSQPDLIIVDLMMEELDAGLAFCTQVRKSGRNVPVYLLSSVGDKLAATTDSGELGFTGVLQKPFTQESLLKLVGTQLRG